MSDTREYRDSDGNPCDLGKLVRLEPEWAANQIRHRDALERELSAARAELDELRKSLEGDAMVHRLEVVNGGLNIVASHPIAHAITASLVSLFRSAGGINFVSISVHHPDTGQLDLTLQRAAGKTPAEMRAEALAELATARAEMRRHLPILEYVESLPPIWSNATSGTGIATLNGYRKAAGMDATAGEVKA